MGVTNLDSLTLSGTLIAPSIIGTVASNSAVIATADNGSTQTLTAAMVVGGGAWTFHTSTGGTTPSLTLPTAANLIAGISGWAIGDSYVLRIINANSGTATILTNTGITLTGTATIATNANADFVVTYASAGAVTVVRSNAIATTVNGLTVTASTGTLTVDNGATLATSGAYVTTLTSTAATAVTLPTTGTLATLAGTEALTGKTINGNTITTGTGTLTLGAGKTLANTSSITLAAGADSQTFTFPSVSDTVACIGTVQTFTAAQTFPTITATGGAAGGYLDSVTAGTTVAAFSNNGLTTFGSTLAKTYTLSAPVAGCFKFLHYTGSSINGAASTAAITIQASTGNIVFGTAGSSNANLVINAAATTTWADHMICLRGESSTKWVVQSVIAAGTTNGALFSSTGVSLST